MFSALFSMSSIIAQTEAERQQIIANYDLDALDRLKSEYASAAIEDKQNALELAAIYGWEEFKDMPNGGIAELIGVYSTGKPKYYVTNNREGGITTRANRLHTGGSSGLNLNGENMVAGEWDGGAIRITHPLLEDRVTQVDNPGGYSDHAIHVAGTMIGTGDVAGGAAKGMAPEADLLAHDWFSDSSEMIAAAANGLLVSNHSYGSDIFNLDLWQLGYYDGTARGIDNIAYNAPHYLSVWSAGNDRQSGQNPGDGGYDYLHGNGVSKNSLVVAATFEVLNYSGPGSVVMSGFSSWGPTDDGRIKPDISAKGVNMYSSVGVSGYSNYSGTSMASPSVAGSILLLQQHYNNTFGEYMLSATLRGLALHTADEAGTTPGPDYRFGWGLLNVEKAADVISKMGTSSTIIEEELEPGDVYTFTVQAAGSQDLEVSLTWTDVPGERLPAGPESNDDPTPMLVNDLDLRVSKDGGATYLPWKLNPATPSAAATTGDNVVDNIEKIEIPNASGEYIIKVSHKGVLTEGMQAFSVIVTGMDNEEFNIASNDGLLQACAEDGSADFEIDLGFNDGSSDTINFTVSGLPGGTSGSFSPSSLNSEGTTTLTVDGIGGLSAGEYPFVVTAAGSSETIDLYLSLKILGDVVPTIGLIFPEDDAVDMPIAFIFEWEDGDSTVISYNFELGRNADFSNLEFEETTTEPNVFIGGVTEGATYYWRVKANTICAEGDFSEAYSFVVEGELGVNDITIDGLVAYPNPITNILNVEATQVIDTIEVLNVLGQKLYTEQVGRNVSQIDLSSLQTGNYFVRVTAQNNSDVIQVIKN